MLDLMLPGMDGLDVARALKADDRARSVPIVMLTAKGEDADVVAGLELGADDYVTKPFSPRVLSARVKAVPRRRSVGPVDDSARIRIGPIEIDPGRREVFIDGAPIELTYTEFQLLLILARRPGWVFTRSRIDHLAREGYQVATASSGAPATWITMPTGRRF